MNLDKEQKILWEASKEHKLPPTPNKNEIWDQLAQQIEISENNSAQEITRYKISKKWFLFAPLQLNLNRLFAFSVFFLLSSPIVYQYYYFDTISAKIGQIEKIKLSDGSLVTLNSESNLTYNKNYNISNRSVNLIGEAYFDINKSDIPFKISTDFGEVTVLGTSFNIRSREDGFEVGVNSGIVEVSHKQSSIKLSKGQLIKVTSNFDKKVLSEKPYPNYPDWMNQKFYCNSTTLKELSSEIERTFNIEIEFSKPELETITVTGVIDAPDLQTVLHTISLLTQHEFKLEGVRCTIL